jgi:hypothetical protein
MIDFPAIARCHLQRHRSALEERCCPDQFVGVVSDIERSGDFTCRVSVSERPSNLSCVLLVLESPHTSEFDESPGPAKGSTGRNIVRYLRQVPGLQEKGDFGLLLINAVQFQCSLGRATSEVRDAVFFDTWASGGRTDFESRFQTLYRDGDCVVNCCTRGNSRDAADHLRTQVHRTLAALLPAGTAVLRRNHPSFWHVPANRFREWTYTV